MCRSVKIVEGALNFSVAGRGERMPTSLDAIIPDMASPTELCTVCAFRAVPWNGIHPRIIASMSGRVYGARNDKSYFLV